MKKSMILALLLAVTLLWGCQSTPGAQTTEPEGAAFTGDFAAYEPRYTEKREREWEEDILFFAEKYLTEHSYLSDANFFVQYQPDLSGNVEYLYDNSAFDPQKRQAFVEGVDGLLAALPELSDQQISYEMARLVAALGDVHSRVFPETTKMLSVFYEPFYHENGVDFRITAMDERKEELMLAKLVSYNGIPVEEIVERVSAYIPHESDRALGFELGDPLSITGLNDRDILVAAGIAGEDDGYVLAEFETAQGLVQTRLGFRYVDQIILQGIETHPMLTEENLRCSSEEPYWWTMIDDHTVYMQLTTMVSDYDYTIDNLFSEVRTAIRDSEVPLKIILDFRGNGGGYVHETTLQGFINTTGWYAHDGVYILIDGQCFSAGVMAPYYLRQAIDGAVLVGAPTGQGLVFPANSAQYELPNNRTYFRIGDEITCVIRDWEGDALEPDVTVYQTLEDYENMVDTVLAWALAD